MRKLSIVKYEPRLSYQASSADLTTGELVQGQKLFYNTTSELGA